MKGRAALSATVGLVVIGVVSANAGTHGHGLGHPGGGKSPVSSSPGPRAGQHTGSAGTDEKNH
ncbi:hypothetical protein ACFYXJ_35800 [Streptomyces sp. NPDC002667]|uniref:hypothetical protein n=1 Tax=Streptomyces sp. NPDC002667 TaxID=3364657 RepID=UPI00368E3DBE